MSTEPTAPIEALFHEIVDLTPARRSALLQARCGADPDLLRQLESLVHAYDHVSTIFGGLNPAYSEAPLHNAPPQTAAPPTHRRYQIVREIGRGGMGVVYLGTDLQLDRAVALKFLHAGSATDAPAHTRLLAEARAAAMLDHPNVATIYEVGQSDDGRLFIAMAYCPGESLRARLERGPLPADDAVRLVRQVADALAAAHSRGLVHRDIKPANLLFSGPDQVKVVDFGIAARGDPKPPVLEGENIFIFLAGSTAVGVRGPDERVSPDDSFSPFRVGLDHVALTCSDETELQRVANALESAGVENTGVKRDETLGKNYVAFKDPDRIAWEFYMA